jgi:murein L,D-transpeptidase YcbB/YkuD
VIVNPTWILPRRVEQGELLTSVEEDPDYLAKKNIRKVRLGSGEDVLVQGAGGGNVLGKVKFLLEESNAVYLHDTDKRGLFKKRRRDFSHGCMRVEGAEEFARWLLERDGAPAAEVERAFVSKAHPIAFDLKTPINLVTEYITVDLTPAGEPVFLDDIYKYDDAYWNDKLPPTVTLPWGSALLRPRWVPLVDAKTVAAWKAEGKSAPRDLGPDGKPKKPAPPKPEDNEP